MRPIQWVVAVAALTFGLVSATASPQSLNGEYKALLTCAKLPFTDAPLDDEPVKLVVANGKATYSRTLYGQNRKTVSGKETGSGKVAADGAISLTGSWRGIKNTMQASYSGKLTGGDSVLNGKHVFNYQGGTYDRSCTLTVKAR